MFAKYSYHACITGREGDTLELEAGHRRHAGIGNAIRDLKYGAGLNHLPSGRFAANAAWLAVQVMAHNLARWTGRIALDEPAATTKTSAGGSSPWPDASPARPGASSCICPKAGRGKTSSTAPWPGCVPCHSLPDGGIPAWPVPQLPNFLADRRQAGPRLSGAAICPGDLPSLRHLGPSTSPLSGRQTTHSRKSIRIYAP